MTSNRFPRAAGHALPSAGLSFGLLATALLALAAWSACGGTAATTTNDDVGVNDAAPPRLGSPDGGKR